MPPKPVVLVTERIADAGLQLLEKPCEVCAPWRQNRHPTEEEIGAADAVVVRLFKITDAVLSVAPKLRVVGRHGAGLDNVDLKAATERRIPVVFTPSAQTMANAVAEHAVQMMLALARHAVAADRLVREGHFAQRSSLQGAELHGRTLGVIGVGAIGARVAEICQNGFGMRVVAYDPYVEAQPSQAAFTLVKSLHQLLEQSDVVTLHLPSTPEAGSWTRLPWRKPSAAVTWGARPWTFSRKSRPSWITRLCQPPAHYSRRTLAARREQRWRKWRNWWLAR